MSTIYQFWHGRCREAERISIVYNQVLQIEMYKRLTLKKYIMKQILTIFLISACIEANARDIIGTVLSDKDSTEVVGATCKLLSEGKIVTSTSSGLNGEFELETGLKTKL